MLLFWTAVFSGAPVANKLLMEKNKSAASFLAPTSTYCWIIYSFIKRSCRNRKEWTGGKNRTINNRRLWVFFLPVLPHYSCLRQPKACRRQNWRKNKIKTVPPLNNPTYTFYLVHAFRDFAFRLSAKSEAVLKAKSEAFRTGSYLL